MAKKKITTTTTTVTTEVVEDAVAPATTLINMVVDMSGSMNNVWDATIDGINEYVNGHKKLANCDYSLTLFDDVVETPIIAMPVAEVPLLTKEVYKPRGMTALRDAVGRSIHNVEQLSKSYDKVLFVIMTDGGENSSREYKDQSTLNSLIQQKRKAGWEFIFLGANQDAWTVGQTYGFSNSYNYSSTVTGSANMFSTLTRSSVGYAQSATASVAPDGRRTVNYASTNSAFKDLSNLVDTDIDNSTNGPV